ncbi:hypothetical protein GCM10017567_07870 [Amycolatopsis bullii]|uniref:Uncharacterized protein n=1 Tax=Amycolatopsis bullii TaxID=941987 RepID=A0ABQ3K107_9PSEU|nr:hypothetical protein GCM10017567_07870 [Amycolatopsis bullii]
MRWRVTVDGRTRTDRPVRIRDDRRPAGTAALIVPPGTCRRALPTGSDMGGGRASARSRCTSRLGLAEAGGMARTTLSFGEALASRWAALSHPVRVISRSGEMISGL